ncbi:hypothetical protein [Oryzomonas rubra]|uniref:Uncharacterized protein n=1 Tax=Oryzomonas rubra TaxID=2509454 RepID=A0A5A9X6C4_9BACT|nr:hypothetical protein [Oryzomonas rubra]KAA0888722.1 hypothetical protein ET418_15185 [Oryzomonas rubra]
MTEANELLRSAHEIAKREGVETNWEAFKKNLLRELKRQAGALDETDEQTTLRATCTAKTYRLHHSCRDVGTLPPLMDMVDRLRNFQNGIHGQFFLEAADRIERLTSDNQVLHLKNEALKAPQRVEDAPLWCVHIEGPDDLIAMPSMDAAGREAAKLNKSIGRQWEEGDPEITAIATLWPYSAESHAKALAEAQEEENATH